MAQMATQAQSSEENASEVGLGDIVVTARRRAESLQSVPVAVTAITPEVLRSKAITTPYDLLAASPGLQVQTGSASRNDPIYFIRGQGQTSQGEVSVVQYFAEVPQPTFGESIGSNIQFYDLENIQVLKGPQGTLFGRSSTGGAVLFTPKKPGNAFDGFAELTVGNYGLKEVTAAINIPLIDNVLSVRLAGNLVTRDGFARSLSTGQRLDDRNRQSYRISALFTPTDWLSNYAIWQDNSANENGTAIIPFRGNPNLGLLNTSATGAGRATATFICGLIQGGQPCIDQRVARLDSVRNDIINGLARVQNGGDKEKRRTLTSGQNFNRFRIQQIINNTQVDLPLDGFISDASIKNIFSTYRIVRTEEYKDITFTSAPHALTLPFTDLVNNQLVTGKLGNKTKFFDAYSEELQFSGKLGGKHDFLFGYFYETNKNNQFNNAPVLFGSFGGAFSVPFGIPGVSAGSAEDFKKSQRGMFASGTFDLSDVGLDGLKFTAGYRRSKIINRLTVFGATPTPTGLIKTPGDPGLKGFDKENGDSYTFSLDYKLSPNVLLYATTRRGFKQGGVNIQGVQFAGVAGAQPVYRPEVVTDVELGAKTDWSAGDVDGRTNIAVYNSKFKDVQRANPFNNPAGGVASQIGNIAKSRVRGFEIENTIRYNAITASLNYGYIDAKYLEFPGTLVNSAGVVRNRIDSPYTGAPKHKVDVDVAYQLPLDEDVGQISVGANYSYQSLVHTNDTALEDALPEGTTIGSLLNLRAEWRNVKGNPVDLSFYVRNVFNKTYVIGTAGLMASLGAVGAIYGDPRTVGLRATYRFGASGN